MLNFEYSRAAMGALMVAAQTMALIAGSAIRAEAESNPCTAEWAEYVAEVSKIVAPLRNAVPIFFTSPDGLVYNCLNLTGHDEVFAEATAYANAFPAIENPLNLIEPSDWPVGFCSSTNIKLRSKVEYYSVDLPRDANFLKNPICKKRVLIGVNHDVEGIKK